MLVKWQSPRASQAARLLVLLVIVLGCADLRRGPASDEATSPGDDPVFENNVYPILQSRCQDCHSKGGDGEYTPFVLTGNAKADRAMVVALVSPSFPQGSLLLLRATGYDHLGGQLLALDDPDYPTIEDWIASLPRSTCP